MNHSKILIAAFFAAKFGSKHLPNEIVAKPELTAMFSFILDFDCADYMEELGLNKLFQTASSLKEKSRKQVRLLLS